MAIRSRAANQKYRDNFDRIFARKPKKVKSKPCTVCEGTGRLVIPDGHHGHYGHVEDCFACKGTRMQP